MSGTSLDGVDVALCLIDENRCQLEASFFSPMDDALKDDILLAIDTFTTLKTIGELDHRLAQFYAVGVKSLLEKEGLLREEIVAIGSHGQTVWHEPQGSYPFSMQLGNPSLLATLTGIDVVADFRAKDVAMGGEGAPFAPAFHHFLFSHLKGCSVVNIGGMANITVFEPELIGYDIGCGNVLMDMWIREHKKLPYDQDGLWAKSGTPHRELLNIMLNDNYYRLKFPKSTGREYFNKKFLIKYMDSLGRISHEDIQATLLSLTVESIAIEVRKFNIDKLLLCGGGAKNIFLIEELQRVLPAVKVTTTNEYGVSSDDLEAMIFAWFAFMRLEKRAVPLGSVTGAKKSTILGGIYAAD
jgi:anhydro-N-acetylmuramic acid kinase